jgi:16S rRNA (uracil1498-N3)-methyltransferase
MKRGGASPPARRDVHSVLVAPGSLVAQAALALDEEERHHLRVRRAATGEKVRLLDGAGTVGEGTLIEIGGEPGVLVERIREVARPPDFLLIVGAGDKERFGWLAEKSAELGVTDLSPLKTDRTRSVAAGIREGHVAALQRRARQAIKQSGSPWAPRVTAPVDVRFAASQGLPDYRWLADATGEPPPQLPPDVPLVVVVGPEGGLVPPEREVFLSAGFRRVRLAPDLLRFETAALAAAAVVASQRPRRPL